MSCRELPDRQHTVSEVVELDCELLSIISSAYGLVLVSRTTAGMLTVALYATRLRTVVHGSRYARCVYPVDIAECLRVDGAWAVPVPRCVDWQMTYYT